MDAVEDRMRELWRLPAPGSGSEETDDAGGSHFTDSDLDAARELAEYHRLLASELPSRSQIRGLLLRCAGHWSRLGAIPRNGLAEVERERR